MSLSNPNRGWREWFKRGWWFEAVPDDTAQREIIDLEEIYQAFKGRLAEEDLDGDRQTKS